eukprot:TRINITY_DN82963_c0_g1_i1.p1 TRINITY_DN82963_c0_g1~~TRINITY_DN82963_c0_g1_i1.p1  ORF type:complete len:535 (-),score=99.55 TRINITY_DN82963_c0_g1_i1:228-1832(-)
MRQSDKPLVAFIFICLLVGHDACSIQRNAATTLAVISAFAVFDVMGMRVEDMQGMDMKTENMERDGNFKKSELFKNFFKASDIIKLKLNQSEQHFSMHAHQHAVKAKTCNADIVIDLSDGALFNGKSEQVRIKADQYRDAGEKGFMFGFKQTPKISCTEFYAVSCVDGQPSWRYERGGGCMNMLMMWDDHVTVTPFGDVINRYQEASASGKEEFVASRYMDAAFPSWVKKIQAYPAELDCKQAVHEAEAAESDLAIMIGDLCQSSGDSADPEKKIGGCHMRKESVPPLDKFARKVNAFMSSKNAVRSMSCSGSNEDLKTSPIIAAIKYLYIQMQSSKMSGEEASSSLDSVIDSLSATTGECSNDKQCIPNGLATKTLIEKLVNGKTSTPPSAEDSYDDITADADTLLDMAKELEKHPEDAENAMRNSMSSSSLIESGELGNQWGILAWAAGTAAVLFFLYLMVTLLAAILVFIAVHIWSILALIAFSYLAMVALFSVLCAQGVSTETMACSGSRAHYVAKADRLGFPRYLVGRI